MKKLNISDIRTRLAKQESDLRSTLDEQSSKIENIVNSNITKAALIGLGAITAILVFNSLTSKKKKKKTGEEKIRSSRKDSKIAEKIIGTALKTAIPYVVDKIRTKETTEEK